MNLLKFQKLKKVTKIIFTVFINNKSSIFLKSFKFSGIAAATPTTPPRRPRRRSMTSRRRSIDLTTPTLFFHDDGIADICIITASWKYMKCLSLYSIHKLVYIYLYIYQNFLQIYETYQKPYV